MLLRRMFIVISAVISVRRKVATYHPRTPPLVPVGPPLCFCFQLLLCRRTLLFDLGAFRVMNMPERQPVRRLVQLMI